MTKNQGAWLPVRIDGTELRATSEVHHRRLLALQRFVASLLSSPVREQIAKVVLFGSVAWGDPEPDSDIDVLIVGLRALEELDDRCICDNI